MNTGGHRFIFSFKRAVSGFYLLLGALFACACQTAVTPVGNLQTPTPAPEIKEPKDDFTEKLEYVQKGAFTFIYVFRRKDGAALDSDDSKYLRANAPLTNYWVVTDDRKTAIGGSNYQVSPEGLDALKKRFNLEDLSKPPDDVNPEANSNAGNKANAKASNKTNLNANNKVNANASNKASANADH
jgi:hypothetical protein